MIADTPPAARDNAARVTFRSGARPALAETVRESAIDLTGLHRHTRWLGWLGYLIVVVLLGITLGVELFGERLPTVEFDPDTTGLGLLQIPFLVLVVSSITFALGWAFVLTGASDSRRRLFLPVVGLFLIQVGLWSNAVGDKIIGMMCLTVPFVVALTAAHFFTRRLTFWRDRPLLEFLAWLAVLVVGLAVQWGFRESDALTARALNGTFSLLILLAVGFWIRLGVDAVEGSVALARRLVAALRVRLPKEPLNALTATLLLARPALALLAMFFLEDGYWLLDLLVSFPLILWATSLVLTRRWSARWSATLLSLSLASTVITLALSLAFQGQDVTEVFLAASGIFPPVFLFVGLTVYDVLSFGTRYTTTEGQIAPRSGRVLMYFGVIILVTSFVLFSMNVRSAETGELQGEFQSIANGLLAATILLFGPVYLVRVALKRREELIGAEEVVVTNPLVRADRFSPSGWVAVGLFGAIFVACAACAGTAALVPPQ